MALGYEIGTIMKRTSTLVCDGAVSVKLDDIEGMTHQFIQVCSMPSGISGSARTSSMSLYGWRSRSSVVHSSLRHLQQHHTCSSHAAGKMGMAEDTL